jgi:dTDP-4-amino-4,6-dideoxygalactose transaminase
MGLHFGGQVGDCPITEDISDRLLRLPFYYGLTPKDQAFVIQNIYDFFKQRNT